MDVKIAEEDLSTRLSIRRRLGRDRALGTRPRKHDISRCWRTVHLPGVPMKAESPAPHDVQCSEHAPEERSEPTQ